jgi:hypothetical protein
LQKSKSKKKTTKKILFIEFVSLEFIDFLKLFCP